MVFAFIIVLTEPFHKKINIILNFKNNIYHQEQITT